MAYQVIPVKRIAERVRRLLNQQPLLGENVSTEAHIIQSPSTRFSDDALADFMNNAIRNIISRCKACHVYNNISTSTTNDSLPTSPVFIRLLTSRVFAGANLAGATVRCRRRSVDANRRLGDGTGLAPTLTHPIYTWEDGRILIENSDANPDVEFDYVSLPSTPITGADLAVNTMLMPIDCRFEAAVIYYVAAKCYQRLRQKELHDSMMVIYEDEIFPYTRDIRTNFMNDSEIDIE